MSIMILKKISSQLALPRRGITFRVRIGKTIASTMTIAIIEIIMIVSHFFTGDFIFIIGSIIAVSFSAKLATYSNHTNALLIIRQ